MSDPVRRSPLNGFRAFLALACLAAAAAGWSATPGVLERLALTGGALAGLSLLLAAVLTSRRSESAALAAVVLEGRFSSLTEHLSGVEQALGTVSVQSSQIRERLSLLEQRLNELEQAHDAQESALREAREQRQQRLQELKQTLTAHRQDLSALTETLAHNGRPDLHLVASGRGQVSH